jgi:hypothetical protein
MRPLIAMGDIRTPPGIFLEALANVVLGEQQDATLSPVVFARYVSLLDRLHAIAPSFAEFESLVPPKFSKRRDRRPPFRKRSREGIAGAQGPANTQDDAREAGRAINAGGAAKPRPLAARPCRDVARAEKLLASEAGRRIGFDASASLVRRPSLRHMVRKGFEVIAGADLYLPEPPASGRDSA